jgi:hypothetical protein
MRESIVDHGGEGRGKPPGEPASQDAPGRGLPESRSQRRRFRDFVDGPIEDLGPIQSSDPLADARAAGAEQKQAAAPGTLAERFEVPDEMRAMAETSVEQARQVFDGLLGAAQRLVDTFGGQSQTAGKGAKEAAERALTLAEQDIADSFDFARKLARARNMQEVLDLQAEYVRARWFPPKT